MSLTLVTSALGIDATRAFARNLVMLEDVEEQDSGMEVIEGNQSSDAQASDGKAADDTSNGSKAADGTSNGGKAADGNAPAADNAHKDDSAASGIEVKANSAADEAASDASKQDRQKTSDEQRKADIQKQIDVRAEVEGQGLKYGPITYLDENNEVQTIDTVYYDLASGKVKDDSNVKRGNAWYVVTRDCTFKNRLYFEGDVKIVINDHMKVTFEDGIEIKKGSLTIYGGPRQLGKLVAHARTQNCAGIAGTSTMEYNALSGKSRGEETVININSGNVDAAGCEWGAGIGGNIDSSGGVINIRGGNITARGDGTWFGGSAGIGAGDNGEVGTIRISGGTVNATGGGHGAGIGGGDTTIFRAAGYAACMRGIIDIDITGGDVTAQGGDEGAGIGAGNGDAFNGTINISGGTVRAKGGKLAAGIGGGDGGGHLHPIFINGTADVEAAGGKNAAGIGGGEDGDGGDVYISDHAKVKATGGRYGAGIGGGYNGSGGSLALGGSNLRLEVHAGEGKETMGVGRGEDVPLEYAGTRTMDKNNRLRVSVDGKPVLSKYRENSLRDRNVVVERCGVDGAEHHVLYNKVDWKCHKGYCGYCGYDNYETKPHEFGEDGDCTAKGCSATKDGCREEQEADQSDLVFVDFDEGDHGTKYVPWIRVHTGDEIELPSADELEPEKGYFFEGWSLGNGETYKGGDKVTVNEPMDFTAQWRRGKIVEAFTTNDDCSDAVWFPTMTPDPHKRTAFEVGEEITVKADERRGWDFLGWYEVTEVTPYPLKDRVKSYGKKLSDSLTYVFKVQDDTKVCAVYRVSDKKAATEPTITPGDQHKDQDKVPATNDDDKKAATEPTITSGDQHTAEGEAQPADGVAQPTITLGDQYTDEGEAHKVSAQATRSLPEGWEVIEQGMLYARDFDNPTEENFVLGGQGVMSYTFSDRQPKGSSCLNVPVEGDDVVVAQRGYMRVKSPDGRVELVYSNIKTGSYASTK